ncbi:TPA: substrate-binding domain-containing protein [Escherichia coli]|uniref:substrate-binding domain-containing protein n=1 Tax=Achromobacter sp. 413638 TaxID=3342385 RepID=UPI00287E016D|nr:substrate-binding domain-containing protein [Escherichia coli]HEA1241049.1 substrate-binding domain-containing protein [Escherichia coli]HEA1933022.1 substrate-binding domain-containing protein [Escherichia coli]HEA2340443.1 substrate-binding domain-containing protein [Escherichia coli]
MHNVTSHPFCLRLAVTPGVSSSQLSALLALHRAEAPEVAVTFFEVTGEELRAGLREGRYDAGVSLQVFGDPDLRTQPLWTEIMAVALPPRFRLLERGKLTLSDLKDYPVYRWQEEVCPLLDEQLVALMPLDQQNVQRVTSFEMMALWVAAGYGVGIAAHSRIVRAHGWGLSMRPLADGPYEVVTYLQRPHVQVEATDRFERRALQVAKAGSP